MQEFVHRYIKDLCEYIYCFKDHKKIPDNNKKMVLENLFTAVKPCS